MAKTKTQASMQAYKKHLPHNFTGLAALSGPAQSDCHASAATEVVEYEEEG